MPGDPTVAHWERYTAGWEESDPEAVVAAFAPGGTIEDPAYDEPMSGDEIAEWVADLLAGFPDVTFEERARWTTDEAGVIAVEWTLRGTHTGTFQGLPPTNRTIELDGVDVVTGSEDGIESIRVYYDQSSITEQLGLTFPTVIGQLPKLAIGAARNAL